MNKYNDLPVLLTASDVMIALSISQSNAYRKLNEVKKANDIPKNRKVVVTQFCKYFDIELEIFYQNFKKEASD